MAEINSTKLRVGIKFRRTNLDALISRHGTSAIHFDSIVCSCYNLATSEAQPHCPHCGGLGYHWYNPSFREISCLNVQLTRTQQENIVLRKDDRQISTKSTDPQSQIGDLFCIRGYNSQQTQKLEIIGGYYFPQLTVANLIAVFGGNAARPLSEVTFNYINNSFKLDTFFQEIQVRYKAASEFIVSHELHSTRQQYKLGIGTSAVEQLPYQYVASQVQEHIKSLNYSDLVFSDVEESDVETEMAPGIYKLHRLETTPAGPDTLWGRTNTGIALHDDYAAEVEHYREATIIVYNWDDAEDDNPTGKILEIRDYQQGDTINVDAIVTDWADVQAFHERFQFGTDNYQLFFMRKHGSIYDVNTGYASQDDPTHLVIGDCNIGMYIGPLARPTINPAGYYIGPDPNLYPLIHWEEVVVPEGTVITSSLRGAGGYLEEGRYSFVKRDGEVVSSGKVVRLTEEENNLTLSIIGTDGTTDATTFPPFKDTHKIAVIHISNNEVRITQGIGTNVVTASVGLNKYSVIELFRGARVKIFYKAFSVDSAVAYEQKIASVVEEYIPTEPATDTTDTEPLAAPKVVEEVKQVKKKKKKSSSYYEIIH